MEAIEQYQRLREVKGFRRAEVVFIDHGPEEIIVERQLNGRYEE